MKGSRQRTSSTRRILIIVLILVAAFAVGSVAGLTIERFNRGRSSEEPAETSTKPETSHGLKSPVSTTASSATRSVSKTELFPLMEGTPFETNVYVLSSGETIPGPTLFVLAGVHGDEPESRISGQKLTEAEVTHGTLIVLPEANKLAIQQGTRGGTKDLNRCFPGNMPGANEDKLAAEIFQVLQKRGVQTLLTFHVSSGSHKQDPKLWGQTIIFDFDEIRRLADEVQQEINREITDPLQQYTVFIEPIKTSATYESWRVLHIPGYGLEVASSMGSELCNHYHLRLAQLFCEKVGVKVENWPELLGQ